MWHENVGIPAGYLLCNGQAISRTTYANLFSVIGTSYGAGDGSTTFNVPAFNFKAIADNQNINVYNYNDRYVTGFSKNSGLRLLNFDYLSNAPVMSYSGDHIGNEEPIKFITKESGSATFLYADFISLIYRTFTMIIKY